MMALCVYRRHRTLAMHSAAFGRLSSSLDASSRFEVAEEG
uniref:Uncharacterized protein n=1 Tax=Manihot esculenta TaxID=3983 RepID=A0A2C9W6Y6_MANES